MDAKLPLPAVTRPQMHSNRQQGVDLHKKTSKNCLYAAGQKINIIKALQKHPDKPGRRSEIRVPGWHHEC